MAQYELPSIQGALLKSVAGRQGEANDPAATAAMASAGTGMVQTGVNPQYDNIVKQDLSVLADQAGDYSAGVTQGLNEAQYQNTSMNARLDEAKRQQDAQRAIQAELDAQQTEALRIRQQAQAQDAANRIAEIQASAAAARRGGGSGDDPWQAQTEEAARKVRLDYLSRADSYTGTALDDVLRNAASPSEAMALFRAGQRNGAYSAADPDSFQAYTNAYFGALGSGTIKYPDQRIVARGNVLSATRVAYATQRQSEAKNGVGAKNLFSVALAKARK